MWRYAAVFAFSAIAILCCSKPAPLSASEECWNRNPYQQGANDTETMQNYVHDELWCSQFVSRFDGKSDYFYLHFPPNFDKTKTYPLILWFRAYGQSDGAISDVRMFAQVSGETFPGVPAIYDAIVVGMGQRGDASGDQACDWLGDYAGDSVCPATAPTDANRAASKKDVLELINQLSSAFNISHIFAAGASMGGYVSLRLLQLYPTLMSGAITSAPALCVHGDAGPPACTNTKALGTMDIYNAASSGAFDDKLVYTVVGAQDDVPFLLQGDQRLRDILNGRSTPLFHYKEVTCPPSPTNTCGHMNYYADDYNALSEEVGYTSWLIDNKHAVPTLAEDIKSYISAHPKSALTPPCDWMPPANTNQWYLTDRILNLGLTKTVCGQAVGAGTGGSQAPAGGGAGGTTGGSTDGGSSTSGTSSASGCSLVIPSQIMAP
jgi:hypothetical protein